MRSLLARLLHHPRLPWIVGILGILLTLPALGNGLVADDWYQRALMRGDWTGPNDSPLLDLFVFMPGAGRGNEALFQMGVLPWWADPDVRAGFFRPLSALTHLWDQALWPDSAPMAHLHSLLWWGLCMVGAWRLYRKVEGPGIVAGLALLLFVVDDAHSMIIGWIANRNALVAMALGLVAINAHLQRRLVFAVFAFGLALLAGESGLGAAAYLFAFELCRSGKPGERLARLVPYGLLIVLWRLVYEHLDYGASGSGLYVDPGHHPFSFLQALVERWPLLVVGTWTNAPIDFWLFLSRAPQLLMSAGAIAGCLLLWRVLRPRLAGSPEARMWLMGSTLSMIPLCATFPTDRLLLWPGLGAFALIARLLDRAGFLTNARPGRVAWALALLHLPLAAVALPARIYAFPAAVGIFHGPALEAPTDAALAGQTLFFLNGFELAASYTTLIRGQTGIAPLPRRIAVLGSLLSDQDFTRVDAQTLDQCPVDGLLANSMDRMFWAPGTTFALHQRFDVHEDFDVEILSLTDDDRPACLRLRFRAPLENGAFRFVAHVDGHVEEWSPPAVGETARVLHTMPMPNRVILDAHSTAAVLRAPVPPAGR